jgi:purine-nucleoside phosphorylase
MKYTFADYQKMADYIREKTSFVPLVGAVLGSGLGDLVNQVKVEAIIPYKDVPGLPVSTNKAHKGQFIFGTLNDVPCLFMQGRLHYYEGYTSEEVTSPIRLMKLLGIKYLLLTNAAGGCGANFHPGDLMIITDHITSFMPSPLYGNNIDEFGPRFPDMSEVYNADLTNKMIMRGKELGLPIKQGTYLQFAGPQYESKAEVQMAIKLGASACGMSTAIEALVANHMGLKTVGFSLITNLCTGLSDNKLSDDEVVAMGKKAAKDMTALFVETINILKNDNDR